MSYYNTTHESATQLDIYDQVAKGQEEVILNLYRRRHALSPSIVHSLTTSMGYSWPLTSVRRAITNLTRDGKISRTNEKQVGFYDRPEYKWIINYSEL